MDVSKEQKTKRFSQLFKYQKFSDNNEQLSAMLKSGKDDVTLLKHFYDIIIMELERLLHQNSDFNALEMQFKLHFIISFLESIQTLLTRIEIQQKGFQLPKGQTGIQLKSMN